MGRTLQSAASQPLSSRQAAFPALLPSASAPFASTSTFVQPQTSTEARATGISHGLPSKRGAELYMASESEDEEMIDEYVVAVEPSPMARILRSLHERTEQRFRSTEARQAQRDGENAAHIAAYQAGATEASPISSSVLLALVNANSRLSAVPSNSHIAPVASWDNAEAPPLSTDACPLPPSYRPEDVATMPTLIAVSDDEMSDAEMETLLDSNPASDPVSPSSGVFHARTLSLPLELPLERRRNGSRTSSTSSGTGSLSSMSSTASGTGEAVQLPSSVSVVDIIGGLGNSRLMRRRFEDGQSARA